jgi:ATP-dependent exoDNAse (exonuclease V) alpha subunit
LAFHLTRTQFPVRLAFAMTINKSQGQSLDHVGIDLRRQVFAHGQLYVALSRTTDVNRLSILLSPENFDEMIENEVYPEVLTFLRPVPL